MKLEEIKAAVESGKKVYWVSNDYEVIKDSKGQWLIMCPSTESCIGLTWRDGVTLNGCEWQFYMDKEDA